MRSVLRARWSLRNFRSHHLALAEQIRAELPGSVLDLMLISAHIYWYMDYVDASGQSLNSVPDIVNLIYSLLVIPCLSAFGPANVRLIDVSRRGVDQALSARFLDHPGPGGPDGPNPTDLARIPCGFANDFGRSARCAPSSRGVPSGWEYGNRRSGCAALFESLPGRVASWQHSPWVSHSWSGAPSSANSLPSGVELFMSSLALPEELRTHEAGQALGQSCRAGSRPWQSLARVARLGHDRQPLCNGFAQ